MTEDDLYGRFFASRMFKEWHWFRWHFEHRLRGENHPLAQSIVRALLACERALPGFAAGMCDELGNICGRERHMPHWEQLLQRMCEIHVIHRAVTWGWPMPVEFSWEPRLTKGAKNPELSVTGNGLSLGIEVKAPSLFEHMAGRSTNPQQVPARLVPRETLGRLIDSTRSTTLPRDNPVKDFLVSANDKFSAFRDVNRDFRGVLVIIWDDFVFEPISSLLHPACGLLTDRTFFRAEDGRAITFPNVDGVLIVRHLHQFLRACRDEPFADSCEWAFDYGEAGVFPFKVYVPNPAAMKVQAPAIECFQGHLPNATLGAEYMPTDLVWWRDDEP